MEWWSDSRQRLLSVMEVNERGGYKRSFWVRYCCWYTPKRNRETDSIATLESWRSIDSV